MTELSPYRMASSHDHMMDRSMHAEKTEPAPQAFISLLEFVSEIYQVSAFLLLLLLLLGLGWGLGMKSNFL